MDKSADPSRLERLAQFKALHEAQAAFVIPNAWNAGTAKALAQMGFKAIATTSNGYAVSIGKTDSLNELTRAGTIENAREIADAVDLPVSADLEAGFGDDPEACAVTIEQAAAGGLVGGTIEDATGDRDKPIYDFNHAVERIHASVETARRVGFVLTARSENFLWGRRDLDDTLKRLQAFEEAGADVLYAPGLPDIDTIEEVCSTLAKPVNVVMGLSTPGYSVAELEAAGVKRISTGGALARTAHQVFLAAAKEIKDNGTFTFAYK